MSNLDVTLTLKGRNDFTATSRKARSELSGIRKGVKAITLEQAKQRELVRSKNRETTRQARRELGLLKEKQRGIRRVSLAEAKAHEKALRHNRQIKAQARRELGFDRTRRFDPDAPATNLSIAAGAAQRFGQVGRQAISEVTTSALDYGKAIAEVTTLTNDISPEQVRAISEEAARSFGELPADQARAFYQIVSAGTTDAAKAQELLTASNRLAVGGVTDVTSGFDALNAIMKPYRDQVSNAEQASDALFATMRQGKTTIPELSQNLAKVTPLAAEAGIKYEEVLAGISTITAETGAKTDQAAVQLAGFAAKIVKPSKQAEKEWKRLGLRSEKTGEQFASMKDALKELGVGGLLDAIQGSDKFNDKSLGRLFEDVRALRGVLSLSGENAKTFARHLDGVRNAAGETDQAVDKMADTHAMRLKKARAEWELFKIQAGETILPELTKMAQAAGPILKRTSDFARAHPKLVSALATGALVTTGLATVAAPVLQLGAGVAGLRGFAQTAGTGVVGSTARAAAGMTRNLGLAADSMTNKMSPALRGVTTAAGVAAAAFVGWEIGKWIDEMTGASDWISTIAAEMSGVNAGLEAAYVSTVTNRGLEDVPIEKGAGAKSAVEQMRNAVKRAEAELRQQQLNDARRTGSAFLGMNEGFVESDATRDKKEQLATAQEQLAKVQAKAMADAALFATAISRGFKVEVAVGEKKEITAGGDRGNALRETA